MADVKSKFLFLLSFFSVFSCSLFNIQDPVEEFFDYNTASSKISRYELSGDYNIGTDGSISVSPGQNFSVNFYMDNPQNFSFSRGSSMEFDVAEGESESVSVC